MKLVTESCNVAIKIPARGGDSSEAIGGEAIAGRKHDNFEILKRLSYKLQALVAHHHPLQPNLLQPRVRLRHRLNPRIHVPSPSLRHQIEVSEVRLPLQLHGSHFREPPYQSRGAHGVAVPDEDSPPAPPLDLVPRLADEGNGVPIIVEVDKGEYVLQNFFRKREARSLLHCRSRSLMIKTREDAETKR